MRSPRLSSMWLTRTEVVPMTTDPSVGPSAPVPIADVIESIVAAVTGIPGAMPSASAAPAVTSPTKPFIGTSGASFDRSRPVAATSSSS